MKPLTYLMPVIVLLLLTGCSPMRVQRDYDPDYALASLKIFGVNVARNAGDPLNNERIIRALTRAMERKGYALDANGTGSDFVIYFRSEELYDVPSPVSFGFGFGSFSRNVGVSVGTSHRPTYNAILVKLWMVDTKSGSVFWSAQMKKELETFDTPEERQAFIQASIDTLLETFPKRSEETP